jgi:hypothetical protein
MIQSAKEMSEIRPLKIGVLEKQIPVSAPFESNAYCCETCEFDCQEAFILLASHFSHDPSVISSLSGLFMTLIAMRGCISHSHIPSEIREKQAIRVLEKIKNTFDHLGFLCVDHDLPVLYLIEAKTAIDCGITELRKGEQK